MMDLIVEVGVPEAARDAIAKWLELVKTWNARIDLTAAKTDRDLVDLMVADALVLASNIARDVNVVDIGSGAGAPGLALALLRPDLKITLVEPLTKRVSFLRTVIGTLGRTDIAVVKGKGEEVATTSEPRAAASRSSAEGGAGAAAGSTRSFDIAISRATLNPTAWVPLGLQLAPLVWTLLAREEPPIVEGASVDRDISYTWPLAGQSGAARRAVRHAADSVLQHATSV